MGDSKKEWRAEIRRRKNSYSKEQLAEMSSLLTQRIALHPHFQEARLVLLYHALPDEVDTASLFHRPDILLPKVSGPSSMELRRYEGAGSLEPGAFGILEPTGPIFTDYDRIDLAIVPGMAFDTEGNRLGRGKGYYDRMLPLLKHAYKIGVCFPFQHITPSLPTTPTDVRMDEVIYDWE